MECYFWLAEDSNGNKCSGLIDVKVVKDVLDAYECALSDASGLLGGKYIAIIDLKRVN